MSRDSIYNRYKPLVKPENNCDSKTFWFIFNSDKMLVNLEDSTKIPFIKNLVEINIDPVRKHFLGTLENYPCYTVEVAEDTVPQGMSFIDLHSLYEILDEDLFLLAGRAIQIINWDKNHVYCGKCGTPTETMDDEMAKICPECGFTSYTRLSPAVITAIIDGDKILMAKHSYGLKDRYSLIAGFLEAGETLEEAVQREVMEEVGLKVKNIKYFGSQPWPFPNSLMIGFTAEYADGEITVDGNEIVEAKWFDVNEVQRFPSKMSIASELLEWYFEKYS